jgi:hypothetical protein
VLDTPASSTDGFPWRDTCVSSTQLNRPVLIKQILFPPQNYDLQKDFFQKLTHFSQRNNALDTLLPTVMIFLGDIDVFLQLC